MKRPAFQFYPSDWRKDPALSACSMAARGLWIELMCIAHESDSYGHLEINGKAMTAPQLARMVGESPSVVTKLLAELDGSGVFSRTTKGVIYSRRMVNDEHIRNVRADAGRLGGNPNLVKQKDNHLVKQNVEQNLTPSSSSSYSVAKATAAVPPEISQSEKSKTELWRSAVSLLEGQGVPESQARTLIGKLTKDYKFTGEDIVFKAIESAVLEQPADARAYLKATCQRLAGEKKRDGSKDWTAEAI